MYQGLFHLHKEILNSGFVVGAVNLKIKCVKNASYGIYNSGPLKPSLCPLIFSWDD